MDRIVAESERNFMELYIEPHIICTILTYTCVCVRLVLGYIVNVLDCVTVLVGTHVN